MKDLPRRAGQPSWLTSSRAPSTQPRNADFLVAIAPYFLLLLSPILSLGYPPSGALLPSLSSTAERRSLFSLFFLFPRRARTACVQTFAFRLRNEARHPTLDTCKMAEFNRKALFAARSWRGGRGGPPILITLISIPFLWRLCGGVGVASIDSP